VLIGNEPWDACIARIYECINESARNAATGRLSPMCEPYVQLAETTGISWTKSTFNPWIGCTKVGPGCDHCYAAVSTPARAIAWAGKWGVGEPRRHTSASLWNNPKKWNEKAKATGEFWPVFCASLADVFDNEVDSRGATSCSGSIEATPHLTWQLVTKRVGNVDEDDPVAVAGRAAEERVDCRNSRQPGGVRPRLAEAARDPGEGARAVRRADAWADPVPSPA
jgi:hypothetical protein